MKTEPPLKNVPKCVPLLKSQFVLKFKLINSYTMPITSLYDSEEFESLFVMLFCSVCDVVVLVCDVVVLFV